MRTLREIFLVLCLLFSAIASQAQDVAARADAFNAAIGEKYSVRSKGKMLVIGGFREGRQVKVDRVSILEMDIGTLHYSATDNTVAVKCYPDIDGCVKRVLLLDKKKSYHDRLVFAVPDGASGEEIAERLKLLLNVMAEKY